MCDPLEVVSKKDEVRTSLDGIGANNWEAVLTVEAVAEGDAVSSH